MIKYDFIFNLKTGEVEKEDSSTNYSVRYYKNNNIKKDGLRKTENRGKIQRYACKECGYR